MKNKKVKKRSCNNCEHYSTPNHLYHYCEVNDEVLESKEDKRFAYNFRVIPYKYCTKQECPRWSST